MRRILPRAVAALLTISMLVQTGAGCKKRNSAESDMNGEGGSVIGQDGTAGGNSAGATERVAGKYSYRGVYLDLPAEDGWKIYEIGNILFNGGSSGGIASVETAPMETAPTVTITMVTVTVCRYFTVT